MTKNTSRLRPDFLHLVFKVSDFNHCGILDIHSFEFALSRGPWLPFQPEAVRFMYRTLPYILNFGGFAAVMEKIQDYYLGYYSMDTPRNGYLNRHQMKVALAYVWYIQLPTIDSFLDSFIMKYDKKGQGTLTFDEFLQCILTLNRITTAFVDNDKNRNGCITTEYQPYLEFLLSF